MPIIDVQRRFRELGRIRMGEQVPTANGRSRPAKLTEWRLTSTNRDLLDVAAEVYGGTVREWTGAPTEGKQWELHTGTDRLDVLVPPGEPLSQHWEMWSGGGCVRRCDGVAQQTGERCACPADLEQRSELSKKGQACKATTRLSIVLPRIPDIGVWRIETHGMNAAVELPGTVEILRVALDGGGLVPAQLRIDQRTSKKDGETRHFIVPVLELPTVTMAALQGQGQSALASPTTVAIGSGGAAVEATPQARPAPTPRALPPLPRELVPCPESCGLTFATKADAVPHLLAVHGWTQDEHGKIHPPSDAAPPRPPADDGEHDSPASVGPSPGAPPSRPGEAGSEGAAVQGAPGAAASSPAGPSPKQLGMIHALLGTLGVPDEDRHRYVGALLGCEVTSMKALDKRQASALIDALKAEEGANA